MRRPVLAVAAALLILTGLGLAVAPAADPPEPPPQGPPAPAQVSAPQIALIRNESRRLPSDPEYCPAGSPGCGCGSTRTRPIGLLWPLIARS
jgi:hypothetical protein